MRGALSRSIIWNNCKDIVESVVGGSTKPREKFSQCTLVLAILRICRPLSTHTFTTKFIQ